MANIDKKVALVFHGFEALDSDQKAKFQGMILDYMRGNAQTKVELHESVTASLESFVVTKMQTGPSGGGCVCCGR